MGPDLELKGMSETVMEVMASKENGNVARDSEDKFMQCTSNCEDVYMEPLSGDQSTVKDGSEDVDVTDCINCKDNGPAEDQCQDATESSSSFGDSLSGTDNGAAYSDAEVESRFSGGNPTTSVFDGFGETFQMRKKKLTAHWRRFVRPIMWRCKWIELKMKACQSQASKYDRVLAEYDQGKQFSFENCTSEDFHAKSLPFSGQIRGNQVTMRKKRKRVELTTDISSYMSRHNLFSYYENKRSDADHAFVDDCVNLVSADKTNNGKTEFGFDDELSSVVFRNNDNSLEEMLSKIEVERSRVRELKSRIDKVVSENPGKFVSINKLNSAVPCDAPNSSAQIPSSSENGGRLPLKSPYTASQPMSACDTGKLLMPDTAVSSHGEMTPLPDQKQVVGSCKNTDGILVNDHLAKVELHDLLELEKPDVPMEGVRTTIPQVPVPVPVPGPDLATKTTVPCMQSHVKPLSVSKPSVTKATVTKRKGRRKARSNRWSRR